MPFRRAVASAVFLAVVVMHNVPAGAQAGPPPGGQAGPAGAPGRGGPGAPGRGGPGGPGGGFGAGPFTPAAGAKDLKSVLFNWAWHMGMLRSGNESELIKTLDYHAAAGTIQVDGQPCTLTKYRVQANYQVPGYREQIECTRANKQKYSNVQTVSGTHAWDEDMPGAELVPGKGKATPRPAALEERLIRLWASPQGAPKAAIAGAAGLPPSESFGQNPALLLDRQAAAGAKATTTLSWEGEKAVVTFPIPGVPGAMATATLNNYLPERVVVTSGTNKTEFVYGKFADWNNPLFKIEALYAGTIVERQNGTVVRNVTAKVTEIGQIYVVMPVPASVRKAGK
ncbi:MAG TPA: hypothetical protein VI485_14745 [Vicinamibacterales bacterium]|nr:hypothetical protein [Vicinamibacterales bacterium]